MKDVAFDICVQVTRISPQLTLNPHAVEASPDYWFEDGRECCFKVYEGHVGWLTSCLSVQ